MESLFLLIPVALVFCAIAIKLLLWAIDSGQYDDLDKESWRILNEDETGTGAGSGSTTPGDADEPDANGPGGDGDESEKKPRSRGAA